MGIRMDSLRKFAEGSMKLLLKLDCMDPWLTFEDNYQAYDDGKSKPIFLQI